MSELMPAVRRKLTEARELAFLGPTSIDDQVEHSMAFVDVILSGEPGLAERDLSILDLGAGGGVPGLIIAIGLPQARITLLDGATRRTRWLATTVVSLGLAGRVTVVCQRAEEFGRQDDRRESFDVVTSRSFGPPAVVAECAAPLLKVGGRLIVSEPPSLNSPAIEHSTATRWPLEGVAQFGFDGAVEHLARGRAFVELTLVQAPPPNYPRRVGIPHKRPRF
ncbi:MAG: 16S rRNA (guanine(527)-N(7))-methyltransferase RsmG [Acidimicrobiales bacterium]